MTLSSECFVEGRWTLDVKQVNKHSDTTVAVWRQAVMLTQHKMMTVRIFQSMDTTATSHIGSINLNEMSR